jgi:hypothetical protein
MKRRGGVVAVERGEQAASARMLIHKRRAVIQFPVNREEHRYRRRR